MLTKTTALVIRKTPYTDNSAVVQLFTREAGLLPFLVQGLHVKKTQSGKAVFFQPGNVLEVVFNRKPGALQRIKEVQSLSSWGYIPSPAHDQVRWFFLEILQHCLIQEQIEEPLFDTAKNIFEQINQTHPFINNLVIASVFQLSDSLGFALEIDQHANTGLDLQIGSAAVSQSLPATTLTPQEIQLLNTILASPDTAIGNAQLRKDLFQKLTNFLCLHALHGKPLQTLEIIKQL